MKISMTKSAWLFAGLALACFWPATARAQAETTPDTYKEHNAVPHTSAAPAKVDFQGKFTLPFEVRCHGHKMPPGQYTLTVKTVNDAKMATIEHDGKETVLQVSRVSQSSDSGKSAVMVRHGPGPRAHTVESVYVEPLNMMMYLDESGHTGFMDRMFASLKRVPIT